MPSISVVGSANAILSRCPRRGQVGFEDLVDTARSVRRAFNRLDLPAQDRIDTALQYREVMRERSYTMYVYIKSEPGLYTTGFYDPQGKWHSDEDYNDKEQAAKRVAYLNGNKD